MFVFFYLYFRVVLSECRLLAQPEAKGLSVTCLSPLTREPTGREPQHRWFPKQSSSSEKGNGVRQGLDNAAPRQRGGGFGLRAALAKNLPK